MVKIIPYGFRDKNIYEEKNFNIVMFREWIPDIVNTVAITAIQAQSGKG